LHFSNFLCKLSLRELKISNASLSAASAIRSIQTLDLTACKQIDERGLKSLGSLALKELVLARTLIDNRMLVQISRKR
jgi:hypothetical protein